MIESASTGRLFERADDGSLVEHKRGDRNMTPESIERGETHEVVRWSEPDVSALVADGAIPADVSDALAGA